MAEVDEIRNGEIERVPQREHLIGNGTIKQYVLSEHEFEILGEYKEISIHLSICAMCVGLFFPSFINLFNNDRELTNFWIANFGAMILGFGGGIYSAYLCFSRMKKFVPVYKRLKEKGDQLTNTSKEQNQNPEEDQ